MLFEINLDKWCVEYKLFSEPIDRTCTLVVDEFEYWLLHCPGCTVVLVSY